MTPAVAASDPAWPGFPDDFVDEALYAPSHWFVHELRTLDVEGGRVVGLIDTERLGGFDAQQRPHRGHDRHVPGAIAIQVTGTLGNLHARYVIGLKSSEGWVGFGTLIREGRFKRLGRIGPPVLAELVETKRRFFQGAWFLSYHFRFEQEGEVVFESDQNAVWRRS